MALTSSEAAQIGWQPFYWLKITGLPYYFFSTIDPTAARFGSFAWSLPAGYSAQRGMDPPRDAIEQAMPDLTGGIASAARCRLRLIDIDLADANGTYKLFGRLVAPGRARNSSAVKWGFLNADLSAAVTGGGTFTIRSNTAFPAAPSTAYIGQEAIGYSAISGIVAGVQTLTISARQKFPCVDAWNSLTWPPPPYYRVMKDASNGLLPSTSLPVSSDGVGLIGRTAALYVGHIDPNGTPTPEANGALLMVGRIKSFEYDSGVWLAEMESVTADIAQATIAPGLERADIKPDQIVVPAALQLRSFLIGVVLNDETGDGFLHEEVVTVAAGAYTLGSLIAAIRTSIAALAHTFPWNAVSHIWVDQHTDEVVWRAYFRFVPGKALSNAHPTFYVRHGYVPGGAVKARPDRSLLNALGFGNSFEDFKAATPASTGGTSFDDSSTQYVYGDGPAPSIMFPTTGPALSTLVKLVGPDNPGSRFFVNQGDGSGRAWVRLSDGQIMTVLINGDGSVTLGQRLAEVYGPASNSVVLGVGPPTFATDVAWYYVPTGGAGSLEQVVVTPDPSIAQPAAPRLIAQLLASDNSATATDDFNTFPEGVGLGLAALLDKPAWRAGTVNVGARRLIVDSTTKVSDVLDAICKEYGFVVVWNPVAGRITLRRLVLPSVASASAVLFDETNRAVRTDTTKSTIDNSYVRSGWSVKIGWDAAQQKFTGPTIQVNNYFAINQFGIAAKVESIADRSLINKAQVGAMLKDLFSKRGAFFQYPWAKCARSINKKAYFLAPGTVHQVVDARIHNPYTGAFGITAADAIYALLTRVSVTPATGLINIEFVIQAREPVARIRAVAPTGLVDFNANAGGYARGYLVGPPDVLQMANRYTKNLLVSTYDGIDFAVGDKIRLQTKDNDGAPAYTYEDEIAAISSDGQFITLVTGGWFATAWSATSETIVIGETYDKASATQLLLNPFLGSAKDGEIAATVLNHIWA